MEIIDYLNAHDMQQGSATPAIVRKIINSGEVVGPDLAYELTGKPDQHMSIRAALRLAGCKDGDIQGETP